MGLVIVGQACTAHEHKENRSGPDNTVNRQSAVPSVSVRLFLGVSVVSFSLRTILVTVTAALQ
jgi:hypothetical protein